jgi:hypothetical protein
MLYASARPITMSHYADTSQKLQKSHGSFILARDFAHILIAQLLEPLCSVIHSALVSPLPTASWPYYKGCQIEDYCLTPAFWSCMCPGHWSWALQPIFNARITDRIYVSGSTILSTLIGNSHTNALLYTSASVYRNSSSSRALSLMSVCHERDIYVYKRRPNVFSVVYSWRGVRIKILTDPHPACGSIGKRSDRNKGCFSDCTALFGTKKLELWFAEVPRPRNKSWLAICYIAIITMHAAIM